MSKRAGVLAGFVVVASIAGALGVAPAVAAPDPVVYQTVRQSQENAFFDITSTNNAQLGQSLEVKKAARWTSLEMGTYQVKLVNDPKVYTWLAEGKYDEKWFTSHRSGYKVKARVTLEVWRYDLSGPIPERIDLALDFTQVHRSSVSATMTVGQRVAFPLKGGVSVQPGRYFFVVGVRFADKNIFNLRFTGQENGTNTMGGYEHDQPIKPECGKYKMTKDAHPGGQAYRSDGSSVPPREPGSLMPFLTAFEVVDTKVSMSCDMDGNFDPGDQIWNPGDLGMVIRGQ
ncbi:MAG: hypothetical protein RL134_2848 [Actinomycetota bacterium]|jgi:hypothetical protein